MASDKERDRPAGPESDVAVVGYGELLDSLTRRIRHAQLRATLAVDHELMSLYWQIGREILVRQEAEGWGTKVIDRLAADLQREFPEMTGLSRTNLKYIEGRSPGPMPRTRLVNRLLAKFRGGTTSCCSRGWMTAQSDSGTRRARWSTGGAALCSFTRSSRGSMRASEE